MPLFFREMKKAISRKLLEMQQSGVKRVAFFGVSDEMEIAYITLEGSEMKLIGILDEDVETQGIEVFGHKVVSPKEVKNLKPDAILISTMKERPANYKSLTKQMERDSI
jgi:FlaA1/EpsC-like NDP-sugar epimerase